MAGEKLLVRILGEDYQERFDSIDIAQLSHAIVVCRSSDSAADAAKRLFAVTRKAKSSTNDSDRLKKYLARFGLSFREIIRAQG